MNMALKQADRMDRETPVAMPAEERSLTGPADLYDKNTTFLRTFNRILLPSCMLY
jgi:hypothetical protein